MFTSALRFLGSAGVVLFLASGVGYGAADAAEQLPVGSNSGLPVPRFVSIKSDRVNVRGGPSREYDVTWVYARAGLPVEITAEFENWRRIRDWEGQEGWVYHSMLSGRRMAMVSARGQDETLPLRAKADGEAALVAKLQPGVTGQVKSCTGQWCRMNGEGYDGWIRQERLWGVYPNEKFD